MITKMSFIVCLLGILSTKCATTKIDNQYELWGPPLFNVENCGSGGFVLGTIHRYEGAQSEYDELKKKLDKMLLQSDLLVLEMTKKKFDIYLKYGGRKNFIDEEALLNAMSKIIAHPNYKSLSSQLSIRTQARMEAFFRELSIEKDVYLSMSTEQLLKHLLGSKLASDESPLKKNISGVDLLLESGARANEISIFTLDEIEEFAQKEGSLLSKKMETVDGMLTSLITGFENRKPLSRIFKIYNTGDLQQLEKLRNQLQLEDPEVHEWAMKEREETWLPKIKKIISTKQKFFIAVGALHIVGNDGLLQKLTSEGCRLTRIKMN